MRRSPLRRRTPLRRGTRRVGQAARERVRAGGVLAKGRQSATLARWREMVADLTRRCGGRCENPACCRHRRRLDPHHVVKRSQGGADSPDNILMLCPPCHRHTDSDLDSRFGRLGIVPYGNETFRVFLRAWENGAVCERWSHDYRRPPREEAA